jgi:hypothetical protein
MPQAASAAQRCSVRIESIEEDRTLAQTRPMWDAQLFAVTMVSNTIVPGAVDLRAYTLGHVFRGQAHAGHWYPAGPPGIFRSSPVVIAFPNDQLLLQVGVDGLETAKGSLPCRTRLHPAYAPQPNMSLSSLDARVAVPMRPLLPLRHPGPHNSCPETSARIARHATSPIRPGSEAPVAGGPYVSLIGVRVNADGHVAKASLEVSSGLPWLDSQVRDGALLQTYKPATVDCRPVPGIYYFSGQFDTDNEDDLSTAF